MHKDPYIKALLEGLHHPSLSTIEIGLERVVALLAALGNPETRLPLVIHVAGTNGKGSVCAYLTAILQAAGLRVHRYTSPHLVMFNERIMLAGGTISDEALRHYLTCVAAVAKLQPSTFFEATTAAAMLAFSEVPADVCILETGLGGRWDATNVVRNPLLTIITTIDRDHMEYLGSDIGDIAREKAGIMKANVPCVVAPQEARVMEVLQAQAAAMHSPLCLAAPSDARTSLTGAHQAINAGVAALAAQQLQALKPEWKVLREHVDIGLQSAQWPARLQRLVPPHPFALALPDTEVWLDGGHNSNAALALAEWLATTPEPRVVICGMLADKDTETFIKTLAPHAAQLIAVDDFSTTPPTHDAQHLASLAAAQGIPSQAADSLDNALASLTSGTTRYRTLLICGSLYLAGKVLAVA